MLEVKDLIELENAHFVTPRDGYSHWCMPGELEVI